MGIFGITWFDVTLVGAVLAAIAFAIYAWRLAGQLDAWEARATWLVGEATGYKLQEPFAHFERIEKAIGEHLGLVHRFAVNHTERRFKGDATNGFTSIELDVLCAIGEDAHARKLLSEVAEEVGLGFFELNVIVRWLKSRGLVLFGPFRDQYGDLAGRGYCLSPAGRVARLVCLAKRQPGAAAEVRLFT